MSNLLDNIGLTVFPTGTSKKLTLDGETKPYPVYRIGLDMLYYNDQNDRIATWLSQYKSEHGEDVLGSLDRHQYNDIIQHFVVQSNPASIERTQMNIALVGQREPGVVLADGRVIDGNRRFTCLRRLHQEQQDIAFFEAVILNKSLEHSRKQIKMLELAIQHGEEKKVDYNPLDRLVGVYQDIVETGLFTVEEYAASTNETIAEVNKRVAQAKLLVEFLNFINMPKQYHVAREYQAVSILSDLQEVLKRNPEDAEQIKRAVFNNIMMKTVGDGRKFIRNLSTMNANGFLPTFLKEQERIGKEIQTRIMQTPMESKAAIDHFVAQNEDLTDDLTMSMDKSLLKAKKKETRSKPSQIVTKSIAMLRDVDTRVVEKLDDTEKDKLRQQVDKLSQMIGLFDPLFDEQPESASPVSVPDADFRYRIAPKRYEYPDIICRSIGKPITSLITTLEFEFCPTLSSTNTEVSFIAAFMDENHQRLSDDVKCQGHAQDVKQLQFVLPARASGLNRCYLGIRLPDDKKDELQQLLPFGIRMMFSSDMDF